MELKIGIVGGGTRSFQTTPNRVVGYDIEAKNCKPFSTTFHDAASAVLIFVCVPLYLSRVRTSGNIFADEVALDNDGPWNAL